MELLRQTLEAHRLCARAVSYQYRYCPRCRHEWPQKHLSCPECVHWLGDRPLERTEWQLAPERRACAASRSYELVGACALVLRIVRDHPPTNEQMADLADIIGKVAAADGVVCGIADQGWLIWTGEGLRRAFRISCEIERRLMESLPRLQKILQHSASFRWGAWVDQYVIPFDGQNRPVVKDITASAIFNFEPDNMLLSSEPIYKANRAWEHFVGAPRRLLDGQEPFGYRMVGHKRPSALDHAEAEDPSPFIGRRRELSRIEDCWTSASHTVKLAITATAGSGKTRLIREWLKRHADIRAVSANFSLFGGAVTEFASQMAELPSDRLDCGALVDAVVGRVHRDKIKVVVLDDLHWADAGGLEFLHALVAALLPIGIFVMLAARPSGRKQLQALQPNFELKLSPLPKPAVEELARRLGAPEPVAVAAALRSRGNPLFVEQFTAWAAETDPRRGSPGPRTLQQVIAARIEHLSKVRIADLRLRLRWGQSWERQDVDNELRRLEAEVGRWLDRLETGDYADRVEAAHHLVHLERLDYEIFLTSMLVGRLRPRSGRLREAIERLLLGSADQILLSLSRRAAKATCATKENIAREAKRAADVLFAACKWPLAADFYKLADSGSLWEKNEIARQLARCRRHNQATIKDDQIYSACPEQNLDEKPSVDTLELPYVWAELGRRLCQSKYFVRASKAAKAISDPAFAAWAERKTEELPANEGDAAEALSAEACPLGQKVVRGRSQKRHARLRCANAPSDNQSNRGHSGMHASGRIPK